jgi:hypothetical protein
VGKLPSDPPALPVIEIDRRRIRLENAKPKCSTTATGDFSFTLCQQPVANAASPMLANHPQATNPFFVCQHHPDDLGVHDGDGLHYGSHRIALMGLRLPYDRFDHHLPILPIYALNFELIVYPPVLPRFIRIESPRILWQQTKRQCARGFSALIDAWSV